MMSISALGNAEAAAAYYSHLEADHGAPEDYYSGEAAGQWSGAGAKSLGVGGEVGRADFEALAAGYDPSTGAALVQGSGEKHRAGWDCTFSSPKSVSSVWARADQSQRNAIEAAHQKAVGAALVYLQDRAGFTRRGSGAGATDAERREPAGLVVATYQHGTSRNQDPQLHTHAVIFNLGTRRDGSTGTLDSRPIFQHKMAAGAAYRAELAAELSRLGYGITEGEKGTFQISGVPEKLVEHDSSRRAQIEAELKKSGGTGAVAAQKAALATRQKKEAVAVSDLRAQWAATADRLAPGWSPEEVIGKDGDPRTALPSPHEIGAKLTEQRSVFQARDVERIVFEQSPTAGVDLATAKEYAASALRDKANIVQLKDKTTGKPLDAYSTPEMIAIERGVVVRGERMATTPLHTVSDKNLQAALAAKPTLSDEQKHMVRHVTQGGDMTLVQGAAGTGKSYALGAARDAWEAEGLRVRGAALSGKAAEGLQTGSGIESKTIAQTLLDTAPWRDQLGREHPPRDAFTSKDVIVIDEAGMVDSRSLNELTGRVEAAGGKVVLVGDSRQLQPIEAGAPFRDLQEKIGAAELNEIRRQNLEADRQAVRDFAAGDAAKAIANLEARGRVHVTKTAAAAAEAAGIAVAVDTLAGKSSLGLAATHSLANKVNEAARNHMREAGALGPDVMVQTEHGEKAVSSGDRLIFLQNDRDVNVKNGDFGTIIEAKQTTIGNVTLTVSLDRGGTREVDTSTYSNLDLGYAATAHKSQGATVDTCHVVAGGAGLESQEWAYVANSRARDEVHVHVDEITREELSEQWERSGQHSSTQQYDATLTAEPLPSAEPSVERDNQTEAATPPTSDEHDADAAAPNEAQPDAQVIEREPAGAAPPTSEPSAPEAQPDHDQAAADPAQQPETEAADHNGPGNDNIPHDQQPEAAVADIQQEPDSPAQASPSDEKPASESNSPQPDPHAAPSSPNGESVPHGDQSAADNAADVDASSHSPVSPAPEADQANTEHSDQQADQPEVQVSERESTVDSTATAKPPHEPPDIEWAGQQAGSDWQQPPQPQPEPDHALDNDAGKGKADDPHHDRHHHHDHEMEREAAR